jgi:hypothetical protein
VSAGLRRLVLLGGTILFAWTLMEVLAHRSDQGVIFGRYSPSYFIWVVVYTLAFVLWSIAAYAAFISWDRWMVRLEGIGQQPRLARWVWVVLASIWLPLLAFVLAVDRTASYSTPQSAAVPLALFTASSLLILGRLAAEGAPHSSFDPVLAGVERLASTSLIRRLEAAAARLSARQHPNAVPLALITLAAAALLSPALLSPTRLLGAPDLQGLFYVVETYTTSSIRAGRYPTGSLYLQWSPAYEPPGDTGLLPDPICAAASARRQAVAWALAIHVWIARI